MDPGYPEDASILAPRRRRGLADLAPWLLVLLLLAVLVPVNWRLHHQAPKTRAELTAAVGPQLLWLDEQIQAGADRDMQVLFPEGHLFTHATWALAWIELGLRYPVGHPVRQAAHEAAARARAAMESPLGRAPFDSHLDPPWGIFHAGWTNQVRVGALLLQAPEDRRLEELAELRASCDVIALAHAAPGPPFVASYPGQVWPVDSVVAMASLRGCDALLGARYEGVIQSWLERAKATADPATGLLGHTADVATGQATSAPRGSSTALILRFLHDLDPGWASAMYLTFRHRLVVERLGVPGVLEHLDGDGVGDIDSGPLVAGVSLSASAIGAGVARIHGDDPLADALLAAGQAFLWPSTRDGRTAFAFGLLPVGDGFGAWSRTAKAWYRAPEDLVRPPGLGGWWLPVHLISLALVVLALGLAWRRDRS